MTETRKADLQAKGVTAIAYFVLLAVLGWVGVSVRNLEHSVTRLEVVLEFTEKRLERVENKLTEHVDNHRSEK